MASVAEKDLPFSARYTLPVHVQQGLGEVSWETVAQLSSGFQAGAGEKSSRVKKIIKELQMSRLLLLDRIRHSAQEGKVDPKLLVDVTRLLQKCEEVAKGYELDLQEFSSFLYLISEKLKKEKLARYEGSRPQHTVVPMQEELALMKSKSEITSARKHRKLPAGKLKKRK